MVWSCTNYVCPFYFGPRELPSGLPPSKALCHNTHLRLNKANHRIFKFLISRKLAARSSTFLTFYRHPRSHKKGFLSFFSTFYYHTSFSCSSLVMLKPFSPPTTLLLYTKIGQVNVGSSFFTSFCYDDIKFSDENCAEMFVNFSLWWGLGWVIFPAFQKVWLALGGFKVVSLKCLSITTVQSGVQSFIG